VIDAWAHHAFAALTGEKSEDEWYAAYRGLTDTLWGAIDVPRMTSPVWPPIAFVASFDDSNGDIARSSAPDTQGQRKDPTARRLRRGQHNASSRPRPPIGPCRRKAANIAPHAGSGAIRVLVLACSSDRLGAFGSANPPFSSVASLSCSAPTVASCVTPCRRPYDVSIQ
jgi:hypothetical protein